MRRRTDEARPWTVASVGGFGSYGPGIGARAGYTFRRPIYAGAGFVHHAGSVRTGMTHASYPSGEIGYDVGVGAVVMRPYGGLGVIFLGRPDGTPSTTGLVYPGLSLHWLLPRSPFLLGVDGRALLPFEGATAFSLLAAIGVNL